MLESLARSRVALWAAIAVALAWQVALRLQSDINHDIAWYYYMAEGLLRGQRLYVDFMEINPPLAAWQFAAVAWLAQRLGVSVNLAFVVLVAALIAVSVAWLASLMRRMQLAPPAATNFLTLLIAVSFAFMPGDDFGQREHILTILFMPWLFLRMARAKGISMSNGEAVAAGALAAAGLCLKPMTVVAPVVVELALLARHRAWRMALAPENLAGLAGCLAYVVAAKAFTPEYFTTMVNMGVKAYVPFIGFDAASIALGSIRVLLFAVFAGVIAKLSGFLRSTYVVLLAAAGVGFLAAYFIQAKGFGYQLFPATYCAIFAAFAGLHDPARAAGAARVSPLIRFLVPAVLVYVSIYPQIYQDRSDGIEARLKLMRPDAKSYFIAAGTLPRAWPMVYHAGYTWGSRFPAQWAIPYVSTKWHGGPVLDDPIVRDVLRWTVDDLLRYRPDILLVDRDRDQAYVPGGWFDYLAFWQQDPRFAPFFADYRQDGSIATFDIYLRN